MNQSRFRFAAAFLSGLGLTTIFGAVRGGSEDGPKGGSKPRYMHVVLFRTQEKTPDGRDEVEDFVRDAYATLGRIPHVRSFWAGRPAAKNESTAGILQNIPLPYALDSYSYDVALAASFDDFAGLQAYLADPLFAKFGGEHDPRTRAIMVFDFITGSP